MIFEHNEYEDGFEPDPDGLPIDPTEWTPEQRAESEREGREWWEAEQTRRATAMAKADVVTVVVPTHDPEIPVSQASQGFGGDVLVPRQNSYL